MFLRTTIMRNICCIKICGLVFVLLMLGGTLNAQNKNYEYSSDLQNTYYSEGIKYYLQHKYLLAEKNLSIWYNDNSWTKNVKGLSALADSYWINRRYKNAYEVYQRLKSILRTPELSSSLHVVKRLSDLDAMRGKYTTAAQVLSNIDTFKNKRDGFLLSALYLRDSVNWIVGTLDGNSGSAERMPYMYNNKLIITTDSYSAKRDNVNFRADANFSKLGYLKKDAANPANDIDFNQKKGSLDNFVYVPSEKIKQLAILHENSDAPLINKSFLSKKSKSSGKIQSGSVEIDPKFLFNIGNISIQKSGNNNSQPVAYFVGNNNDKTSIKSYNKSDSSVIPVSLYAGDYVYDIYKGNIDESNGVSIKNVRKMSITGFYGILLSASVSSDGKVMVFSGKDNANADNYDLYYAIRLNEDAWINVTKFASNINTAGDEVFPQIQNDGTLFFSSDGLAGLGALDIYYIPAFYRNGQINPNLSSLSPQHFGYPINSAFDDYGVFVSKEPIDKDYQALDSLEGYFTTNRTGYDRIYYFKRKNNSLTYSGKVYGKTPGGGFELLPAATVTSYRINNNDSIFVAQTVTDTLGNYSFPLSPNYDYAVKGEKEGYNSSQVAFKPLNTKVKTIDNIYLDKSNPNKDSLNKKVQSKDSLKDSLNKQRDDLLNKKDQLKDSLNKKQPSNNNNLLNDKKQLLNKNQPLDNLSNNKNEVSKEQANKKQLLNESDNSLKNKKQPLKNLSENDEENQIPDDIKRFINGNEKYVKSWVIHHQFDKVSIVEEDEKVFDSIAAFVKSRNAIVIKVYSTADCYGSLEHNDKLANDRSIFVKADLESHGVDRIVQIVGVGKGERVIPCPTVRDSANIARQLANRYTRIFVVLNNDKYNAVPQQNIKPSNANEQRNGNIVSNKPVQNLSNKKQPVKESINKELMNKAVETTMPEDLKHYVKPNERFVISWTVHHEFDRTDIIEEDEDILDSIVVYYKQHPNASLRIYSTADCYGSDEHNDRLAKQRSIFVKGKLESLGLDRIVEVVGVGNGERMIGCPTVRDSVNIARQVYNRYTKIFLVIDSKQYNILPKSNVNTKSAKVKPENIDNDASLSKRSKNPSNKANVASIPDDLKRYVKKNEKFVQSWTIHHEFDNTAIADEDAYVIRNIAAYVKSHPNAIFRIYSTADCYGSDDHNSKLAKERSIFVKNILVSYGVDKILEVVGIANGERVLGCPNVRDSEHIARQIANRYTKIFVVINR